MEGLPHNYTFWGRYSLTYNSLNSYAIESNILIEFETLSEQWESVPSIVEFMPYFKKMLIDHQIQIIGIMAAYDSNQSEAAMPFVYQILGDSIRRINIDNEGRLNYNCVYLEKTPYISRLLRQTQIKNGNLWEDCPAVRLRCDLYSVQKSIDLCRFMLRTSQYVENINSALYDTPLKADISIITPNGIETKIMNI